MGGAKSGWRAQGEDVKRLGGGGWSRGVNVGATGSLWLSSIPLSLHTCVP